MVKVVPPLQTFNRGKVSELALGRTDLDRVRLSAERMLNWIPRTLGSMSLRPGLQYIGEIHNSSNGILLPFIFSATEKNILEFTNQHMEIWYEGTKLTRIGSTSLVSESSFSSSALAAWTDADEAGSSSFWSTGGLNLVGTRYARAKRYQTVTALAGTRGLAVTIARGSVNIRVGSSIGADDYFAEATLRPGYYSFSVTSTGNFIVEFSANTYYASIVSNAAVESTGIMSVTAPWVSSDLSLLRWDQSADVIFVAAGGYKQRRIERYDANSWGIAEFQNQDGPFIGYDSGNRRLEPTGLYGDISLKADRPLFYQGHVGALFTITSVGQTVSAGLTTGNQWTDPIRVSGVGENRRFSISAVSAANYAYRLQRSVGSSDNFQNVNSVVNLVGGGITISTDLNDTFDNQIIYYRIGVGAGEWQGASTSIETVSLSYGGGGITGVAQITAVTGSTLAAASVLSPLGSTAITEFWQEGVWSNVRGWPSATVIHEGRLWFAGKGRIVGSISDAYESFDPNFEGDAGPLNRTIGSGGAENISWLGSLGRLIVGTEIRELQAKTGALEDPLTPTNFTLRDVSNQGSHKVGAIKVDKRLLFIDKSKQRLEETSYASDSGDYETADRTVLVPEQGEPSIERIASQRKPDTRVLCVRHPDDGTLGLLVSDPAENVTAWCDLESSGGVNGIIEDVCVLPGTGEDEVYFIIRREINGSTKRYLERLAKETQNRGGAANYMADAFEVFNSSDTATAVTGLDHLVGCSVVAWGSSRDLGMYVVSSTGQIDVSVASTTVCVGLPYYGVYVSAKLAYGAGGGSALTKTKKVEHVGVILKDTHAQGLLYGRSTDSLDPLPLVLDGTPVSTDAVLPVYDHRGFAFDGIWDTDSRIVLVGQAPRPCTVLAAVIDLDTKG